MLALLGDIKASALAWRKWYLIGAQAVRVRYTRSRLGQFWISLSFLITVVALSIVYSYLWKTDIRSFMPYFATGFLFWGLLNTTILEGCFSFIAMESYMKSERQPAGTFPLVVLLRNFIVFAHNVIVLIPLYLFAGVGVSCTMLLFFPGLLLWLFNLYWIALLLGMLCARYRDIPSLVAALMQLIFFATPILWQPHAIDDARMRFILSELNPFAAMLAVVRDPLLGQVPTWLQYANVGVAGIIGWAITAVVFAKRGHRIVYWL